MYFYEHFSTFSYYKNHNNNYFMIIIYMDQNVLSNVERVINKFDEMLTKTIQTDKYV